LGSSFIHFRICELNDSYGIMLLSAGVSWRYRQFETNRFNRKKLHEPPRIVGITAYLCTVHYTYRTVLITSLSNRVSYSDYGTGCMIRVSDPSRDMIFLFSEMSRQAVGPPSLLFKGYVDSSLEVKWLGHGVNHSFPFGGQGWEWVELYLWSPIMPSWHG